MKTGILLTAGVGCALAATGTPEGGGYAETIPAVAYEAVELAPSYPLLSFDGPFTPDNPTPAVKPWLFEVSENVETTKKLVRVFAIGDSLSQGAHLETVLSAAGFLATADAACGRPLLGEGSGTRCQGEPASLTGMSLIQEPDIQAHIVESDILIVELGTNDYQTDPAIFATELTKFMQTIQNINSNIITMWVNTYLEGRGDNYQAINQIIADSSATVVDYAAVAPNYHHPDGVHMNPEGYTAFGNLIVSAVQFASR